MVKEVIFTCFLENRSYNRAAYVPAQSQCLDVNNFFILSKNNLVSIYMYVNYCVEHLGKDSLTFFISLLRYTLKCVGQYLGQNGEMLVLVTPLTTRPAF